VSSLIAQGTEFPLKKPAGFHWDLFLLGLTTGVAGLLGLPFPNGLIPQAPFHTESLCVTEVVHDKRIDDNGNNPNPTYSFRPVYVVEQRLSNLAQGLLTLVAMSPPLLVVLHLIPQGVLAGLFFIMGFQALEENGITAKLLFLVRDSALTPPNHPLAIVKRCDDNGKPLVRRAAVWGFVLVELVGFGATFAITQTVAAVGFPVFIFLLIPVRALVLPRFLTPVELSVLDQPTASPFTLENVGGTFASGGSGSGVYLNADEAGGGGGGGGRSGSGSVSGSGFFGGGGGGSGGEDYLGACGRSEKGKEKDSEGGVWAGGGRGGINDDGYGGGNGSGQQSEEELAELGEGRMAGGVRRRFSTVNREGTV
jgi:uncharacterized membrane protein YgcG